MLRENRLINGKTASDPQFFFLRWYLLQWNRLEIHRIKWPIRSWYAVNYSKVNLRLAIYGRTGLGRLYYYDCSNCLACLENEHLNSFLFSVFIFRIIGIYTTTLAGYKYIGVHLLWCRVWIIVDPFKILLICNSIAFLLL